MPDAAAVVGNAGSFRKPIADGIAPDNRLAGLVLETLQCIFIRLRIDAAPEGLPLYDQFCRLLGTIVVRIINVLDHRFAGMEFVGVRNMVKEKQ